MSDPNPASPLDAFSGRIEPTRVPLLYQFGLGFVALAMVLLPVIYMALVVGVGWVVCWHLESHAGMFEHVQGRAAAYGMMLYLAPAAVGGILVLFLIKPLFSRPEKRPQVYKLTKADEPLLFEFVAKICHIVGAPVPREIWLDTQVNASAGFRRGWLSFFGNDLVLVIGLPLVAGMTTRQLAGVLAHEFGHFAQGAGMRLSYIIRSVNIWFARVVFERDEWDQTLEDWSNTEELWVKIPLTLARGGVWVGRKVLWCLMHVGHAISCFMSRQMEFDADSYEAKLAGSDEFARTAERLRHLTLGHAMAMRDAEETYQSRELPQDLPALVVWREKNLLTAKREELEKQAAEAKTSWKDTHPADSDRVKAALEWQAPGIFHHEAPASELFANFTTTSQAVTRHFFEHILAVATDKVEFRDADRVEEGRQLADYLEVFYSSNFHLLRVRPVEIGGSGAWRDALDQMQSRSVKYGHQLQHLGRQQERLVGQIIGRELISAAFVLPSPGLFSLNSGIKSGADLAVQQTQREMQQFAATMSAYEDGAARRMAAALDAWRTHHEDEASRQKLDILLTAQRALAGSVPEMMQASYSSRALQMMLDNAKHHSSAPVLELHALAVAQRIEAAACQCMALLNDVAHPYLDGHPPMAKMLDLPDKTEGKWDRSFQLVGLFNDTLIPLLIRIMGDLCGHALEAEKELRADASHFSPPAVSASPDAEPSDESVAAATV